MFHCIIIKILWMKDYSQKWKGNTKKKKLIISFNSSIYVDKERETMSLKRKKIKYYESINNFVLLLASLKDFPTDKMSWGFIVQCTVSRFYKSFISIRYFMCHVIIWYFSEKSMKEGLRRESSILKRRI